MSNFIPNAAIRSRFVSDSGDNDDTGESVIFPKKTLAAVVSAVNALDPAPALESPASIVAIGAPRFLGEQLAIPDNVQVLMNGAQIAGTGGTVVLAGSNAQCELLTVLTSATSGDIGYSTNNKRRVGFDSRAIILNGPNQTGCLITSSSDQVFQNCGQILARFDNSICVDYQSNQDDPKVLNYNELNMEGVNSTGFKFNSTSTSPVVFRCGAIDDTGGVGNKGIHVLNGHLSAEVTEISCAEPLVIDGGRLDIIQATVNGDIIINVGGQLNVVAVSQTTGDVINYGGLNGIVNGIHYGSYKEGSTVVVPFSRPGGIPSTVTEVGRLTLNTTNDTVTAVRASYQQTVGTSVQVDILVYDADTPATVYYSGSITSSIERLQSVTLSAVTPLPVNQAVNLENSFQRITGGISSVIDAAIQIEFTRII